MIIDPYIPQWGPLQKEISSVEKDLVYGKRAYTQMLVIFKGLVLGFFYTMSGVLFWDYLETFNFAFHRLFISFCVSKEKHLSVLKILKSFVDILFLLLAMLRIFTCGNYNNSKQFTVWPKVSHLHKIYWWVTCASLSSTSSIHAFLSCSGTATGHPFLTHHYMDLS